MEYDVIIVGAGSSGAVLATRLSEDRSRSVLLLDAGPDYRSLDELPGDVEQHPRTVGRHHDWASMPPSSPAATHRCRGASWSVDRRRSTPASRSAARPATMTSGPR